MTGTRVGVVGLGTMGAPMARHVLAAGFPLHVTARRPEATAALVADGATAHPTARDLAAHSDVVVTVLPDLPELVGVLEGPDGLLAGVTGPLVLVVCSTSSPAGVRELGAALADRTGGAVRLVDAPVSGGQEGAEAGTLAIMVGGTPDDVAHVLPVLAAAGTPVHLGPLGSGQVAKACNQVVVAATVTALAEAAVLAERAGLDVGRMLDLLAGGYAGSRVLEVKKHRFVAHDHSPSGPARYMVKDLRGALDEAGRTGTATVLTDVLLDVFTGVTDAGLGDLDTSVVQDWIAARTPPG